MIESVLGTNHPETATYLNNLGETLRARLANKDTRMEKRGTFTYGPMGLAVHGINLFEQRAPAPMVTCVWHLGQPDGSYATSDGGGAARAAPVRLDGVRSTACGSGVVRAAYSASVCQSLEVEKRRRAIDRRRFSTSIARSRAVHGTLRIDTTLAPVRH